MARTPVDATPRPVATKGGKAADPRPDGQLRGGRAELPSAAGGGGSLCALIYMFMTWLRKAHESEGKDVIEYVVPTLVATMRMMPRSCPPEVIPMMAGLVIAAGTELSPHLGRQQYGDWTKEEMIPLEATAFLLAEHINRIAGNPEFATRMIVDALTNIAGEG
ncbi:hypothetical protein [Streptomyces sp. NBC_00988]|uniref:hypothetical protein n=1 Tax=Streptomyces sp. NBC_00988 TaxID=2903704 RepID=UPI00386572CC